MSDDLAQRQFLERGGPMSAVIAQKYKSGELDPNYVFREYPKRLRISLGVKTERKFAEYVRGKDTVMEEYSDTREHFREEVQIDHVASGGWTITMDSAQEARIKALMTARPVIDVETEPKQLG